MMYGLGGVENATIDKGMGRVVHRLWLKDLSLDRNRAGQLGLGKVMRHTLTSSPSKQVFVAIAAYNEAASIGDVVTRLRARWPNIVVVDDGSQDDTIEIAAACGAIVIRHPINLGQGAAIQTGLRFALSQGAQYIVTFDADGQHMVDDIDTLLEYQRRHGVDVDSGFAVPWHHCRNASGEARRIEGGSFLYALLDWPSVDRRS